MAILLLVAGMVLLATAGDSLVRGSIAAAQRMHIPPIIIGLTVVAFGTSAPEMIVSIEAALNNAPGLAIGNVVGSNIANNLLVLGVPAILMPVILTETGIRRSATFLTAVSLLFIVFIADGTIARMEGLSLFALLAVYLTYSGIEATRTRKKRKQNGIIDELGDDKLSTGWILSFIGFGIVGLGIGGKLTTEGALGVAEMLGVESSAVGLTIVALGTSLPELAASASAAMRKQSAVIIGNVIGSSIFNILGIAGLTAMIVPLKVPATIIEFDVWIMLGATILLLPAVFIARKIHRISGLVMILAYAAYIVMVFRNIGGL